MMSYIFEFTEIGGDEEMTFDGFQKQAMSMLDELDSFTLG
jgi:hypothetical protein